MTCSSGPPWRPGNTCLSTSLPNASWQRIKPPRGPRRVLWVAAVRQGQAEQRVARLRYREIRGHVRLRPGVRLDVRVLRLEQRLGPIDRELLDLVHHLAAAVIALPRQPFGVLVRERRAHRLEHRHGHEVLARDQLQPVLLPLHLAADQLEDGGVSLGEGGTSIDHASIFATRRSWRPPSNAVSSHLCRMSIPSSSLTNRDGSTSTFASLCLRASSAISGVHASAARTRGKRLATNAMPSPVPQVSTPRFTAPVLTALATGRP